MEGKFEPLEITEPPFYETAWFATVLRNAVALIAVILAMLFGVRPLVKALGVRTESASEDDLDGEGEAGTSPPLIAQNNGPVDPAILREQVGLAQKLAAEQPDRAVEALQRMLAAPIEQSMEKAT